MPGRQFAQHQILTPSHKKERHWGKTGILLYHAALKAANSPIGLQSCTQAGWGLTAFGRCLDPQSSIPVTCPRQTVRTPCIQRAAFSVRITIISKRLSNDVLTHIRIKKELENLNVMSLVTSTLLKLPKFPYLNKIGDCT